MRMRTSAVARLSLTDELLGNCSPGYLARPEQLRASRLPHFVPRHTVPGTRPQSPYTARPSNRRSPCPEVLPHADRLSLNGRERVITE
jgi:hypothetical protein